LLDALDEPITSVDALVERCHRALSAHLWTACCWSGLGAGWKIGDFNYLIVSVKPDADTSLYVQFWSEPRERVLTEISSGETNTWAIRYISSPQRQALESRGYAIGGRARNYAKELVIDSPVAAEGAALEVLQILFEVFGYRGQWPLSVELHKGERAEHDVVYTSVTPDDFAKLAVRVGCEAKVTNRDDKPHVALARGRRSFAASMAWRLGENLYSLVTLQAEIRLKRPVTDEAIARANAILRLAKVSRTDPHTVRMEMPLVLDGGVTAAWLAQSLRHWMATWRECERQLGRGAPATIRRTTSRAAELVH
jgi:hypothetical protein